MAKNGSQNAMSEQIKKLGKGVEIVEELRDSNTTGNLFESIFNGKPAFNLVLGDWPRPSQEEELKKEELISDTKRFLINSVDLYSIDDTATVPKEIFESMAELGLYGIKAQKKYGGRELSQASYADFLMTPASWCGAIAIVLSAHNTIGCIFPVSNYGTQEQKDRFLPEFVKWPTGFCLTEEKAGSDLSRIETYAQRVRNAAGKVIGYEITGKKWFTTNGILSDGVPLAKYLAVVARIVEWPNDIEAEKDTKKFCYGLFIVPTDSEGFDIGTRNTFIGMRGIHNSNPKFTKVFIPVFNLIGDKRPDWESKRGWDEREGTGLKIGYEALNTGRIAIAKSCIGVSKQAYNLMKWWANKRIQFNGPLIDKEMVRDKLLSAAANIMAMEAMANYASLSFDAGSDVRLEAAVVKTFASEKVWQIVDDMMQLRGGRGYETWQSLSRRELTPLDEVIFIGARPNRIFEGSNELMEQLIFREGGDRYKKRADEFFGGKKVQAIFKTARYYLESLLPGEVPTYDRKLRSHLEFVDAGSRRLVRKIVLASARYQAKLAVKQLMQERFSRIAINLGAVTLTCAYARELRKESGVYDYAELADVFCRATRREVEDLFRAIDNNDDEYRYQVSKKLLQGDYDQFLHKGIIPMTEEYMRGPISDKK